MSDELERHELPQPVRLVAEAVDAVLAGEFGTAQAALGFIDQDELQRLRATRNGATRGLPSVSHATAHVAVPRQRRLEIHERDGWRCRYSACGFAPVLDEDVLKLLGRAGLFTYYTADPRSWHQIAWTYQAVVDHVEPRTRVESLWTTACWTCNAAKGSVALQDLGWHWDEDPPHRGWGGLRDKLVGLKIRLAAEGLL